MEGARCRKNNPPSVGRPVRISLYFVIFGKKLLRAPAIGSDNEGLLLARRKVREEDLGTVGRPARQQSIDRRVGQLNGVGSITISFPKGTLGVRHIRDKLPVFGEGDKMG